MENGSEKLDRFEVDSVITAYKRLAERVVNGETGVKETAAGIRRLDETVACMRINSIVGKGKDTLTWTLNLQPEALCCDGLAKMIVLM